MGVACSSDRNRADTADAGDDAASLGGSPSTGGGPSGASGGVSGSGPLTPTGGLGGTGGVADDGGAGRGGAADGGTVDGSSDGGLATEAGPDGSSGGVTCDPPADPTAAKLCLTFSPEQVDLIPGNPALDGSGELYVFVYDTPTPGAATEPLAAIAPYPTTQNVYDLPQLDIDGLPETVYIETMFLDNPSPDSGPSLRPGMFLGGLNLNSGLVPPPPLRPVALTAGQGTIVEQRLTALRMFQAQMALSPTDPPTPEDDGQGPFMVGVFAQRSPVGAFLFGGALGGCVDVTAGPVEVTGLFFKNSPGPMDFYFGGQVDDFNAGGIPAPGALVSADPDGLIPETQVVAGVDKEYLVDAGGIYLTTVYEPGSGLPSYSCPVVDPDPVDAGP
jgi:hypothetical protein